METVIMILLSALLIVAIAFVASQLVLAVVDVIDELRERKKHRMPRKFKGE